MSETSSQYHPSWKAPFLLRPRIRALAVASLCAAILTPGPTRAASPPAWHVLAPVRLPPILYEPSGIALDPAGRLFVTDADPGTVQKLSPSAQPLAVFGSGSLAQPTGIARGTNGH